MNINNRLCNQIGHDKFPATQLCIFEDCKLQQRWCCLQCINQGIHNHGKQDYEYVITWQQIINQKKEEISRLQDVQDFYLYYLNQILPKGLQCCRYLIKLIEDQQQFIEQQVQLINEDRQRLFQFEGNFTQLDDTQINEILEISLNKFKLIQGQLIKPFEFINQKFNKLETNIKESQSELNKIIASIDVKKRKFLFKYIDFNSEVLTSQMSNNENHLAYGGQNTFKIYDINLNKDIIEIKKDNIILVSQFTSDSSMLFVGSGKIIYGFDVQNNFKEIFRKQIHRAGILDIITIQNKYLITSSVDKTIRKTDIKRKKLMFKLIGHKGRVQSIDYNMIDDTIISGSNDQSIKLWTKYKSIIINKNYSHPDCVGQIQLVNKNQYLLSLDKSHNLFKWKIDLAKRDLIRIQEFHDPKGIFTFSQINNNQNLLLICGQYIKILDNQGNIIVTLDHGEYNFSSMGFMNCRQVDTSRYFNFRFNSNIFKYHRYSHIGHSLNFEQKVIQLILIFQRSQYSTLLLVTINQSKSSLTSISFLLIKFLPQIDMIMTNLLKIYQYKDIKGDIWQIQEMEMQSIGQVIYIFNNITPFLFFSVR